VRSWDVRALLIVIAVGACKEEHASHVDAVISSEAAICPPYDDVCNVLAQVGCCLGEKCTWVLDAPSIGHIGCVPDGSLDLGSTCSITAVSSFGSLYDECVRGAFCEESTCRQICDVPGGLPQCGPGYGCRVFNGVFGPANMTVAAGVCVPVCDPLNDNDFLGSGSKPGSVCAPAQGCYALPSYGPPPTVWSCEPDHAPSLVHRSATSETGLDACAQGYEPVYLDAEGSTQVDCIALCAPLDCYAGNCGSNSANLGGAEPHACNPTDARGTFNVASATNNGDQCMYSWVFELDAGNHVPSPTSNTVGFCIDHSRYNMPSCDTLPLGSAAMYGCVSTTLAGVPRPPSAVRSRSIRLGASPR